MKKRKICFTFLVFLVSGVLWTGSGLQAACDLTGNNGYCNIVVELDSEGNPIEARLECEEEAAEPVEPGGPQPQRCKFIVAD